MLNGEFNPTWSTDNNWREEDMERCLSNDLNTIEANITNLQISITALSAFFTSAMISAYVSRNTTDNTAPAFVRIRSGKALSAGTAIYISGWFASPYV